MLLFEYQILLNYLLPYLNFQDLLPKKNHYILLLLLKLADGVAPPKAKLLFEYQHLLKGHLLAVFIVPPVAQAPAVVSSSTFQTLEVELYQTCPSIGLLGSAERF
jgi:hypothetical protein